RSLRRRGIDGNGPESPRSEADARTMFVDSSVARRPSGSLVPPRVRRARGRNLRSRARPPEGGSPRSRARRAPRPRWSSAGGVASALGANDRVGAGRVDGVAWVRSVLFTEVVDAAPRRAARGGGKRRDKGRASARGRRAPFAGGASGGALASVELTKVGPEWIVDSLSHHLGMGFEVWRSDHRLRVSRTFSSDEESR